MHHKIMIVHPDPLVNCEALVIVPVNIAAVFTHYSIYNLPFTIYSIRLIALCYLLYITPRG